MSVTRGPVVPFACANSAVLVSVSTREIIKLWDADIFSGDYPKATGKVKSLFPLTRPVR